MKLIVFTDLDATLLDPVTYSWEAAADALGALNARQASIVLVSSKTLAEMEPIHSDLRLSDPFIVENGGGIAFRGGASLITEFPDRKILSVPAGHGECLLIPLGAEYDELVAALAEISSELGIPLAGFSSMSPETVADLTGLSAEQAVNAKERLFDEPFVLPVKARGTEDDLRKAAARKNLTAVEGGRFWHLIGHSGKGKAVSLLIESYRKIHGEIYTVGLGDSPNDFPFLALVDTAVLLGGAGGFPSLHEDLRNVRIASLPGPGGWNQEVLSLLEELKIQMIISPT